MSTEPLPARASDDAVHRRATTRRSTTIRDDDEIDDVDVDENESDVDDEHERNEEASLYDAVVNRDYSFLLDRFVESARESIRTFVAPSHESIRGDGSRVVFGEEKLDEFFHQLTSSSYKNDHDPHGDLLTNVLDLLSSRDPASFDAAIDETVAAATTSPSRQPRRDRKSARVDRRHREEEEAAMRFSARLLSNARPPAEFVLRGDDPRRPRRNEREEDDEERRRRPTDDAPPLFDGSVGGGGGSLLHLACVLDEPFALALLLVMGADPHSRHSAFRRLPVHEASCNDASDCLGLLLGLAGRCDAARRRGDHDPNDNDNEEEEEKKAGTPVSHGYLLPSFLSLAGPSSRSRRRSPLVPSSASSPSPLAAVSPFLATLRTARALVRDVDSSALAPAEAARRLLASAVSGRRASATVTSSLHHVLHVSDGHGNTALHWAAFKNSADCVSSLLAAGADPNARAQPSGWTPLHDAAYSDAEAATSLLLAAGADVDARANSGATPLCFAAQEDSPRSAAALLRAGADPSARCSSSSSAPSRFSGYAPLHYCAHYNADRAARVLLAGGAPAETRDASDRAPLRLAAARGSDAVLRELLSAGAVVAATAPPLREVVPRRPVDSTKPWNRLSQRAIDECRRLLDAAGSEWRPQTHHLFPPRDRRAVVELLRVGKRLERRPGTCPGTFPEFWPRVLTFCGRGWFDVANDDHAAAEPTTPHRRSLTSSVSEEDDVEDEDEDEGEFAPFRLDD